MSRAVEFLGQDFGAIRTGRASPALLDKVQVEAWGSAQPINALATISVPEPRLLMIAMWAGTAASCSTGLPRVWGWVAVTPP